MQSEQPTDRTPSGQEKLQFVAEQMAADGKVVIDCPYCLSQTRQGEIFCCTLLWRAFEAILNADDQIRITKFMEKVIDRHLNN